MIKQSSEVRTKENLPDDIQAMIHKFSINGSEVYLTIGHYGNGRIGEISIRMAREGSTVRGLLENLSETASLALQSGVPVEELVKIWEGSRYEPKGFSDNSQIPLAKSVVDYVARYIKIKYLKGKADEPTGN